MGFEGFVGAVFLASLNSKAKNGSSLPRTGKAHILTLALSTQLMSATFRCQRECFGDRLKESPLMGLRI